MNDAQHILVTGGAGYLGAMLVPALLAAGRRVTVLDSFRFGQTPLNQLCAEPGFEVVRGDARDEATVRPLAAKADTVIPLAALVGAPLCDREPAEAVAVNRDAVVMLTRLLGPSQRILMPITNSGYGVGEQDRHCTEETPLRPVSLYGRSKVEAEAAVMERGNAISFRLATVFGMSPRMRLDLLVNDFVHRAVTDRVIVLFEGHFRRNYIHIRDVARAFLHGLDRFEAMRDNVYNVGLSDANLSKRELCERIRQHVPDLAVIEAEIGADPDRRDYIVSNEKMERTGFMPAWSLDQGIEELIRGCRMLGPGPYRNV